MTQTHIEQALQQISLLKSRLFLRIKKTKVEKGASINVHSIFLFRITNILKRTIPGIHESNLVRYTVLFYHYAMLQTSLSYKGFYHYLKGITETKEEELPFPEEMITFVKTIFPALSNPEKSYEYTKK